MPVSDKSIVLYPVVFGWEFSPDLPAQLTVSFLRLVPEEVRETEATFGAAHSVLGPVLGDLLIELSMV